MDQRRRSPRPDRIPSGGRQSLGRAMAVACTRYVVRGPSGNRRVSELRVLVLTPDFPPMAGGIQHLIRRVLENAGRLNARVLAPAATAAAKLDPQLPFEVRRAGTKVHRHASLAAINA